MPSYSSQVVNALPEYPAKDNAARTVPQPAKCDRAVLSKAAFVQLYPSYVSVMSETAVKIVPPNAKAAV